VLCLSVVAYNLGDLWRRLALLNKIENWSLTNLQQRLVKTGGRPRPDASQAFLFRFEFLPLILARILKHRLYESLVSFDLCA
jgi:hypothetical protein